MHNLSIKIANFIVDDKNNKDSIQMVSYSLEAILSTLLTTLTALLISFILGYTYIFIKFGLCFVTIRMMHKGFHFKSFLECYIVSNLMIIIACLIIKYTTFMLIGILLFYGILLLHYFLSIEKNKCFTILVACIFTLSLFMDKQIAYSIFISILLDILLIIGRKKQWNLSQDQ